jgi:hypothetical protein
MVVQCNINPKFASMTTGPGQTENICHEKESMLYLSMNNLSFFFSFLSFFLFFFFFFFFFFNKLLINKEK